MEPMHGGEMRQWSPRDAHEAFGRSPPRLSSRGLPTAHFSVFLEAFRSWGCAVRGVSPPTFNGRLGLPRLQPEYPLRIRSPTSILCTVVHGTHLWINLIGQRSRGCDPRGTLSAFGAAWTNEWLAVSLIPRSLHSYTDVLSHSTAMGKKT